MIIIVTTNRNNMLFTEVVICDRSFTVFFEYEYEPESRFLSNGDPGNPCHEYFNINSICNDLNNDVTESMDRMDDVMSFDKNYTNWKSIVENQIDLKQYV